MENELKNKIVNYLKNEAYDDELKNIVRSLNSWNGCLEYLEFFEMFFENKILDAVRSVCFGNYNWNDDFVRFNGYENLESFSEYSLIEEIKDNAEDVADCLIENFEEVKEDLSDELIEIFEEFEEV